MKWADRSPESRDALIAEKVMGWKQAMPYETYSRYLWEREEEPGLTKETPRFSQCLDDAWKLLEHLAIHLVGFEYAFFKTSDRYGDNVLLWICQFDYQGKRFSSAAKEPAEAICLAVLKATGSPIG